MNEWQPIETAPKVDCFNEILLVVRTHHAGKVYVTTGFWDEDENSWLSASNHDGYEHEQLTPTHWMPFPAPPICCPART